MLRRTTKISIYESLGFDASWFLSFAAALNDPKLPPVLTTSYSLCEKEFSDPATRPILRLTESVLLRLAVIGTSVFVSSGDKGSSGCAQLGNGDELAVGYPASSAYVTAVGGTRLVLDKANRRVNEVAWNDSDFVGGNFVYRSDQAGGGGTSTLFKRPWWQTGNTGSKSRRTVPDISAHASGAPAWPIYFADFSNWHNWAGISGTSLSTPVVASGFALIAAKELTEGRPKLGLINPWLYSTQQRGLFDVIAGNNDLYQQGCCNAKKGYDRATGLGVPKFANLQKQLPNAR